LKSQFEEHGFSLDEVKEWKAQLQKAVHDHPILAASVAVGAGVLIARLIQDAVDDDTRKERSRRRGGLFGSELGRALMGSLATMAAAKLQETLLEGLNQPDEEEEEEPEPPRRTRPRKQGRSAAGSRTRPTTQRRRKPIVEE
jgi:tRNA(Ile2) C34 agmatinyltransferase TiaS